MPRGSLVDSVGALKLAPNLLTLLIIEFRSVGMRSYVE